MSEKIYAAKVKRIIGVSQGFFQTLHEHLNLSAPLRKLLKILANKYVLTALVFAVLMLFFDQNDWFEQHHRQKQLDDLQQNIEFLTGESNKMETQLHALNTDSNYLEKYAREHYHEKRDNEDVYLIIHDTAAIKK